jgi:hypothetical protein
MMESRKKVVEKEFSRGTRSYSSEGFKDNGMRFTSTSVSFSSSLAIILC